MSAEIVELLAGDPSALEQRRQAHAGTDSACGDEVEVRHLELEQLSRLSQSKCRRQLPDSCGSRSAHHHAVPGAPTGEPPTAGVCDEGRARAAAAALQRVQSLHSRGSRGRCRCRVRQADSFPGSRGQCWPHCQPATTLPQRAAARVTGCHTVAPCQPQSLCGIAQCLAAGMSSRRWTASWRASAPSTASRTAT